MNIEKICRFKKGLIDICNHPEQKVLLKLNFFRFIGRLQKNAKKIISDTPRLSKSI